MLRYTSQSSTGTRAMRTASLVPIVALTLAAWAVPTSGAAQRRVASLDAQRGIDANAHTTDDDIAAGARAFASRCSVCHGPDGAGNRGPDLTSGRFRHGNTDGALFNNILSGIPGTGMPSVRLSDKEMWQIVAFVRSLSGASDEPVAGDPAAGRRLFERADCARCHFVDGQGGRLGPDLSEVGWIRSTAHLRASILEPDADIEAQYRQVSVTDVDGRRTGGLLLNEDAFALLMIDSRERLRSFPKSELRDIERPAASLMPSFAGRFGDGEVDDLVAYLASLGR